MNHSELEKKYHFIEDDKGRRLYYAERLAKNSSQKRILFILHGHGCTENTSGFSDSEWNVICPIDNFGYKNKGSWWLGEEGDFFVKKLMESLIEKVKKDIGNDRLYFWGSSMGGYGAILYGINFKAEAVFVNVPQTRLRHTQYTDHGELIESFKYILNDDSPHWIDLTSLMASKPKHHYPLFFITQTRFHIANYLNEHIKYFTNQCEKSEANYYLEILPKKGHLLFRNVADSVKYFDLYREDIEEWLITREREFRSRKFKNEYYLVNKEEGKESLVINLDVESDKNTGNKDLLISLDPNCYSDDCIDRYGLSWSDQDSIGIFRYLHTMPGRYSIEIELKFPRSNYLYFSIKEFYPKGLTIIERMSWVFK